MFEVPVSGAGRGVVSPLPFLVCVVVSRCAGEQMRRITARRIVAAVQDMYVGWYRAVNAFISQSMGSQLSALFVSDDSVPIAVCGASPQPAFVGIARMVVERKPFCERDETSPVAAGFRAEPSACPTGWSEVAMIAESHVANLLRMESVN